MINQVNIIDIQALSKQSNDSDKDIIDNTFQFEVEASTLQNSPSEYTLDSEDGQSGNMSNTPIQRQTPQEQTQQQSEMSLSDLDTELKNLYTQIGSHYNLSNQQSLQLGAMNQQIIIFENNNPDIYTDQVSKIQVNEKNRNTFKNDGESIEKKDQILLPEIVEHVCNYIGSEKPGVNESQVIQSDVFKTLQEPIKEQILYDILLLNCKQANQNEGYMYRDITEIYIYLLEQKISGQSIYKFDDAYTESPKSDIHIEYGSGLVGISKAVTGFTDDIELYLSDLGYSDDEITTLSKVLYTDKIFNSTQDILDLYKDDADLPYIYGETTVSNYLKAGMSLVGQVRYVWGGGHLGSGNYIGISPTWLLFNKAYSSNPYTSITPSYTWCPIHGELIDTENGCLVLSANVSLDEYIEQRISLYNSLDIDASTLLNPKVTNKLSTLPVQGYGHRLDGLDCSGYVGWMLNQCQVDGEFGVDSTASWIVYDANLDILDLSNEAKPQPSLLPGDVIAWDDHVVAVFAPVRASSNCKVYIILEMSPPVAQFSIAYYKGASQQDLNEAKQLCKQFNSEIGNYESSSIHSYNILEEQVQVDLDITEDDAAKMPLVEYEAVLKANETGTPVTIPRQGLMIGRYSDWGDIAEVQRLSAIELYSSLI